MQFVRSSFWAGETFTGLGDAQARVEAWCTGRAGMRVHGTTQCRPVELFRAEEHALLLSAPADPYDVPVYASCKVARDHHVEIAKALYSVPGNLIGTHVDVRADARLVKIYAKGQLVKIHPRQRPGGRSSDAEDLPSERSTYALRDIDHLRRLAARHGEHVGVYAAAVLDHPLPWTKMRQVYALLGYAKRYGPDRVEAGMPPGTRRRSDQRELDRADARAGHRERRQPNTTGGSGIFTPGTVRTCTYRFHTRTY